jgi:carboxyl-terminal processing protease
VGKGGNDFACFFSRVENNPVMNLSRVVSSRATWRALILTAALMAAGCAGSGTPQAQGPDDQATRVFNDGYDYIHDRYIRAVGADQVAMDGLSGLSDVDSSVAVSRADSKVVVSTNAKPVAEFDAPQPHDTHGWAKVTVDAIRAGQTAAPKLKAANDEVIYKAVFDKALEHLDRYSRYSSADEARENRASREGFSGIGVHIQMLEDLLKVISVIPDTPAERAGLKRNDTVVSVDGQSIVGMGLPEVVRLLRGPTGSIVTVGVRRERVAQPIDIKIEREHIIAHTVTVSRDGDVPMIRLTRFNQQTASDLEKAIDDIERDYGANLHGVILDLRDNPGGLLDQAVAVSDIFLSSGRIVSTEGRHPRSFQRYEAHGSDKLSGRPLVVMINGRSASSAEIVAAALQDLGRAVVVGTNSYGKGTVQSVFRLPNDGELTLTWSRFHAPSGYTLQDLGVLPNLCTSDTHQSPDAIVRNLRDGRMQTAKTLEAWRQEAQPNETRRHQLRAFCPQNKDTEADRAREAEVARRVIDDTMLYSQALKLSVPEIATRQP